ncbi:MAG: GPI inositol-deacylase [Aquimonas sp.]|nr:GPI inositol-deacylase [Aquimonas sp.]
MSVTKPPVRKAAASKSPRPASLRPSDLRALVDLSSLAAEGVIDIGEGLHQSVRSTLGLAPGATPERCGGLSGAVYGLVRGLQGGVAGGLSRGLERLERVLDQGAPQDPAPRRLALLSVLNGVLGDRLAERGNPLALEAGLRLDGLPLAAALAGPARRRGPLSRHVVVLLHGLCMNDVQWRSASDPGHGEALANALGATVVHARYNSGLGIGRNGALLSEQLETLLQCWPVPIERISLVGHSMGGLIARSAELAARRSGHRWRLQLRDIATLGSPHRGAPLERIGRSCERALAAVPYAGHFARIGSMRSQGILDLGDGRVADEAEQPLPSDVRALAVAARTLRGEVRGLGGWVGDGLVPADSALGLPCENPRGLDARCISSTGHLELLRSGEVRRWLIEWLGDPA